MAIAGPLLLGSLFLIWSHQLSAGARARYGATAALARVPANPTAWQVYSGADVLLALVAVGLIAVALWGGRAPAHRAGAARWRSRWPSSSTRSSAPPTNGALLFDPTLSPPAYSANAVSSGTGEVLALVALVLGAAGVALAFTVD